MARPAAMAYARVPLAIWSFPGIGRDVDVAGVQVLHQLGQAEKPVHEADMIADAQRLGHRDQALTINLALLALDLRVCRPHDQVQDLRIGGHDPGHGLDHVFQALPAVDEPESADDLPARQSQPCLVRVAAFTEDLWYPMGNHLARCATGTA